MVSNGGMGIRFFLNNLKNVINILFFVGSPPGGNDHQDFLVRGGTGDFLYINLKELY